MSEQTRKIVKVVVLGDIGRSPRMQYHALSLAETGLKVNVIGYVESTPLPELSSNEHITITKLYPLTFSRGPTICRYALKAFWQFLSLLLTLVTTGSCDYLLCQNPPAVPTFIVCRLYCLFTRTKFIIDWHNYAYSIMRLSLSPGHILLKLAKYIEKYFGQSSDHNICVTYAMKNDLLENWNIRATVLYDRPPTIFHPITLEEKHKWYMKISAQYPVFQSHARDNLNLQPENKIIVERTAFTQLVDENVTYRNDRPGLLFSSTSWTQDEDFSILLQALQIYENDYSKKKLPKLICVITGKGPMKSHYEKIIDSKNWQHVKIVTPWLQASDYPTMVASADLGVCLHISSSGLDLPMKIVDMFGAGLPVCAYGFQWRLATSKRREASNAAESPRKCVRMCVVILVSVNSSQRTHTWISTAARTAAGYGSSAVVGSNRKCSLTITQINRIDGNIINHVFTLCIFV